MRPRVDEEGASPLPAPPARLVRAVLLLIAGLTVAGLVGSALAPVLLVRSPLLLIALSPDARHVALVVGSVAPAALVALAVARRALFSLGSFGLGVIYGPAAVTWVEEHSPRLGRLFRALERLFGRWGPPILFLLPFASLCVLAGAARTRFAAFVCAVVLGHLLWVGSTYYLGTLIADFSDRLLAFLSDHLWESTLCCVGVVILQQVLSRYRSAKHRARNRPADAA